MEKEQGRRNQSLNLGHRHTAEMTAKSVYKETVGLGEGSCYRTTK